MSEFNTENVTRSKPFQVEFGLDIAIVTRPDGTQCAEVYEYDIEDGGSRTVPNRIVEIQPADE